MTASPALLKAGLVLIDPDTAQVQRVITLQYNPESLTRSLQAQGAGEGGERSEALRLKGPAVETIRLEAELDATDRLEAGDPVTMESGLHPQLAALEALVQPTAAALGQNDMLASVGTLEILPMEAPLCLFVFGKSRVLPVRVTELGVTEEAFDPDLNPLRARVSLGLRVLTVDDVGFRHKAGTLFLSHLVQQEGLARLDRSGALAALGLSRIP